MRGNIRVGTASWSDAGYITHWYPKGMPPEERLPWYAEHFDLVEVNTTFYQIPNRQNVQRWIDQTPDNFLFDVKLHRVLSHSTGPEFLPPELRLKAKMQKGRVVVTPQLETEVANRFIEALEPCEEAGKMGAFLLQLSPSFRPKTNQLDELSHLAELFHDKKLAIELRNRDWVSPKNRRETEQWFRDHHVTFVMVDGPDDPHFMVMPGCDIITTPELAYIRAHGRDAPKYVRGRTVAERFDYDYPKAEIAELARRALKVAMNAEELHFIFNNNNANFAPKAAEALLKALARKKPKTAVHREVVHA